MTEQLNRLPLYERRKMVRDAEGVDFSGRPRTRGECADGPRPCPWVGCRYHLYLDVREDTGNVTLNRPELEGDELDEMPATCALDIADEGFHRLEDVGEHMNVTRERVRQVEAMAIERLDPRVQRLFAELEGDLFHHPEGQSVEDEA